jgi:hypothetical protein
MITATEPGQKLVRWAIPHRCSGDRLEPLIASSVMATHLLVEHRPQWVAMTVARGVLATT